MIASEVTTSIKPKTYEPKKSGPLDSIDQGLHCSRSLKAFLFLNFLCVVALCSTAITVNKIVTIGPISFPCSNIIFSLLTFPITDIISEVWGKKYSKVAVWIAFCSQALFVVFIQISILLPAASFWAAKEAYHATLQTAPKFLVGGMAAFFFSQMWDVLVYAKLKKVCRGKHLWLRNNLSTLSSQFINSTIIITVVFYGSQPLIPLIIGSLALKWVIALLDTPLVYMGVRWIHKYLGGNTLAYTEEE